MGGEWWGVGRGGVWLGGGWWVVGGLGGWSVGGRWWVGGGWTKIGQKRNEQKKDDAFRGWWVGEDGIDENWPKEELTRR